MGKGTGRAGRALATASAGVATLQVRVVLVMAVLTPLVYSRRAFSPFSTVKASVVLAGTAVLLGAWVTAVIAQRRVTVPTGAWGLVLLGLTVALGVAAAVGEVPGIAIFGAYRRHSGSLIYLCYLVALLTVAARFDAESVRSLATAVLVGCGGVAAAGIYQLVADPQVFVKELPGITSTLGNPNFVSGYLAAGVPLVLRAGLAARGWRARAAVGVLGVVIFVALVGTLSFQGVIAAAAGAWVVAVAWSLGREGVLRRRLLWGTAGAAALGLFVGVAGLAGQGPLGVLGRQRSFEVRGWYWEAALAMWRDHPVLGVGMDHYGVHYLQARSLEAAKFLGLNVMNDAAHSVPLHLLAGGGLVLGLAYAGFVVLTATTLVRGLRRLAGPRLLLLGGVGGAWLAYQVQSLVSIDVPPLALLHFLLAGAILACTGEIRYRQLTAPFGRGRTAGLRPGKWRLRLAVAAGAGVAVVGCYGALVPLLADLSAGRAKQLIARGEVAAGVEHLRHAVDRAPWESRYRFELASALVEHQRYDDAELAFREAEQRQPGSLAPVLSRARLAKELGLPEHAIAAYEQALRVEPHHPALKVELARYLVEQDRQTARARELLATVLRDDPGHAAATEVLARLEG